MKKLLLNIILFLLSISSGIGSLIVFPIALKLKSKILYPLVCSVLVFNLSLAFNPPESYDYFKHLLNLKESQSLQEILTYYFIESGNNFLFPALSFILNVLIKNEKTSLAIISGLIIFLILYSLELYTVKIKKERTLLRLFGLVSISLISVVSGIRFMLAIAFFTLGVYFYQNKRGYLAIILIIMSILTHFSTLLFLPALFFKKKIKNIKMARITMILVVIFAPTLLVFSIKQISLISVNYSYLYGAYIDNKVLFKRNIIWYIIHFFPLLVYSVYFFKKAELKYFYLMTLIISFIFYPIILDRVLMGLTPLFIFPILQKLKMHMKFLLLTTYSLKFLFDIYDNYYVYKDSVLNIQFLL